MRPAIWSGGRPVYCQTTPMTGMRISGKMSVGVRSAASGPIISRSSASTTKVYGRLSAMRTSAIIKRGAPKKVEGPGTALQKLIRWPRFTRTAANSQRQARLPPSHPRQLSAGAEATRTDPDRKSGRAHRVKELADLELEAVAVAGQRLRRRQHLRGGHAGVAGAALHVGDIGRDLHGAFRGLLHVAGNLLGRCALLFHRGRDG